MITKQEIIEKALKAGFDEIGFTTALPFESHRAVLEERKESYTRLIKSSNLIEGTDPKSIMPEVKSIIVLVDHYLKESFHPYMEAHFGKFYIDEDRIIRKEKVKEVINFVAFLRENGLKAKAAGGLPHRPTAARAGIGSVGKNCIMYSRKKGQENSWLILNAIIVDAEYEPDQPTDPEKYHCPDWCKNACLMACPTGALKGPRHLDPRKCISNLSYNASEITPLNLREPMGLWVYGCDRCQNVCPRNDAFKAKEKPVNQRVEAKVDNFRLEKLLAMDKEYYQNVVWPHFFYISRDDLWVWKMNAARVMGNTRAEKYISPLINEFEQFDDERVKGMIAWALGRIGGKKAENALHRFLGGAEGLVKEEIQGALERGE